MILRNDWIQIRVWPKSGTCRVLPRRKMGWESLKASVENALFEAGLDVMEGIRSVSEEQKSTTEKLTEAGENLTETLKKP